MSNEIKPQMSVAVGEEDKRESYIVDDPEVAADIFKEKYYMLGISGQVFKRWKLYKAGILGDFIDISRDHPAVAKALSNKNAEPLVTMCKLNGYKITMLPMERIQKEYEIQSLHDWIRN